MKRRLLPNHSFRLGKALRRSHPFKNKRRLSPYGGRYQAFWLRVLLVSLLSFVGGTIVSTSLVVVRGGHQSPIDQPGSSAIVQPVSSQGQTGLPLLANGRPQLSPLPPAQEVWECDVVVVGGSLGGVAAASHAMKSGAVTCLIELTPWLGGQISSQGMSAIDESRATWANAAFSEDWTAFKQLIKQQPVTLPSWVPATEPSVASLNNCWVGRLCFSPQAGAAAAEQLLRTSATKAPASRWSTSTAFKGAAFDEIGTKITAVYAVRRVPRQPNDIPQGWFSRELSHWYSWQSDGIYEKIPLRLQAPPGKSLMVIDATDTGELVGWAGVPHRLGTESRATTGEPDAAVQDNPDCIQAFTYPFVLAIHDDQGASSTVLSQLKPDYSRQEHQREFSMKRHPMFEGMHNFFNYRRIVSTTHSDPFNGAAAPGDMTIVNWNQGNDWTWMNPPLLLTDAQLTASGQRQNWLGGMSVNALRGAQEHALLFAQWLMETQAQPQFPLMLMSGPDSPMGTGSGLSMVPYIREGRRILGRSAYGQSELMLQEADLREDLPGGRDFSRTAIGVTHYAIDMHGCRYRNWEPSGEANAAPAKEIAVRPIQIPLESLIPQGVDNLLIGGKGIAVTHIANAVTRTHPGEWSIGSAAGATAGWLVTHTDAIAIDQVTKRWMPQIQQHLIKQGLRLDW